MMLDTRQQILQATEVVLATHGFQGLSMHKVAREAGIATGTIYCHFKDKEDLLVQLCNCATPSEIRLPKRSVPM
ncbi:TetR/AcrR family transcriptional regulator [Plesiomonas shigelloides]|uniref:TetR/AcrR family transcriptional regulator n=1 Tax=Plesiomonas shigelloides TaxID=703 RepID=UPI00351D6C8E